MHPADCRCVRCLVDRSSFGTPEAKAARESVSDEQVARVVARAKELDVTADRDVEAVAAVLAGRMVGAQMQRALSRDDARDLADAVLPLVREARDLADAESASRVYLANQLIAAERRLAEVEASVREREAAAWERALREAAEDWATGEWADAFAAGDVNDDVTAVRAMERWLLDRAAAANPYAGSEGE